MITKMTYCILLGVILYRTNSLYLQIYTFKNIRFAAPPTGQWRFVKARSPEPVSGIQDGKKGHNCWLFPQSIVYGYGSLIGAAATAYMNQNSDEGESVPMRSYTLRLTWI
jgi:Carboxylesterase family